MRFIANYRKYHPAHALADDGKPLCGAPINPRKWGYVDRDEIRDFIKPDEKQPKNIYRLCSFCRRKLEIEE